jgi:hypothetical protein
LEQFRFAALLFAGILGLVVADHLGAYFLSGPNRIGRQQNMALVACLVVVICGIGILAASEGGFLGEIIGTTIFLGGATFAYNETSKDRVWFATWCGFRTYEKNLRKSKRAKEDAEAKYGPDSTQFTSGCDEFLKSEETFEYSEKMLVVAKAEAANAKRRV